MGKNRLIKKVERNKYEGNDVIQTRILTFEPYPYNQIELVIEKIKDNLSPDLIKKRKSLMYPSDLLTNKFYGHCYHSTQALFYLMDTDRLVPMSGKDYRGEAHWWLQDEDKIYDATANQYLDKHKVPPYNEGKKSKWYGWKQRPHQSSLALTIRVLGDKLISDEIT